MSDNQPPQHVYIITTGEYSGYKIIQPFATLEGAKASIEVGRKAEADKRWMAELAYYTKPREDLPPPDEWANWSLQRPRREAMAKRVANMMSVEGRLEAHLAQFVYSPAEWTYAPNENPEQSAMVGMWYYSTDADAPDIEVWEMKP